MSFPIWLITGASNGFGLGMCLHVLRAGHRVIGSVRSKTKAATAVEQIEQAGGSVIELDMTESQASIASKIHALGRIDYLINVAGYSILAACEDITDTEATLQMTTDFFGPLYTLQAVLPVMRTQRSGTIDNISSGAAQDPLPACSLYSASKAALEAASESLAKEVAPHNIRVLIVEPGNFRTNFVGAVILIYRRYSWLTQVPTRPRLPPHYDDPMGVVMRKFLTVHGKQPGDPQKAVERIFEAVTGTGMAGSLEGKISRLVLGSDAYARMQKSCERFSNDLSLQEEDSLSTNYA
ncbi:unnamed protein product [Penicillium nalgiovense]|nr:unnamed protein product [Penicillium nalgiovense]